MLVLLSNHLGQGRKSRLLYNDFWLFLVAVQRFAFSSWCFAVNTSFACNTILALNLSFSFKYVETHIK